MIFSRKNNLYKSTFMINHLFCLILGLRAVVSPQRSLRSIEFCKRKLLFLICRRGCRCLYLLVNLLKFHIIVTVFCLNIITSPLDTTTNIIQVTEIIGMKASQLPCLGLFVFSVKIPFIIWLLYICLSASFNTVIFSLGHVQSFPSVGHSLEICSILKEFPNGDFLFL